MIVDNFLSTDEFEKLKKDIISPYFPWYYQEGITNAGVYDDACLLTHLFYDAGKKISPGFEIVEPLLKQLKIDELLRIKANFYPNNAQYIEHGKHRDYEFSHKGLLFYINTNNGFTIIDNDVKVESVVNRAFFFDPSILHQSTSCTDTKYRMNILINYR